MLASKGTLPIGGRKKKGSLLTLETIILIKNQWDPITSGRTLTSFQMYWTPFPSPVTEVIRIWQLCQERSHIDSLLWLRSEPSPPCHHPHFVFTVEIPSTPRVGLGTREGAENQDCPHSDRAVIRKGVNTCRNVWLSLKKEHKLEETSRNPKCLMERAWLYSLSRCYWLLL